MTWTQAGQSARFALPEDWWRILWIGDNEVLCLGRRWTRWDLRTAKIVDDREAGFAPRGRGNAETGEGCLSEDGKAFWLAEEDRASFRGRDKKISSWDFAAGKWQSHGTIRKDGEDFHGFALLPGGQYLHLGSGIYHRETLRSVTHPGLYNRRTLLLAFSADGARLAAVTSRPLPATKIAVPRDAPTPVSGMLPPQQQVLILVRETVSGKVHAAIPIGAGNVGLVRFAPDGRRLAVATAAGTVEIWPLPE